MHSISYRWFGKPSVSGKPAAFWLTRNRGRTALTEVGATLVPPAKSLLESIDRLRKDIAALAAGRKGRLRVGSSDGH